MTSLEPSRTTAPVAVTAGNASTVLKVLGVIINLFWPGIGTLVVGKFVSGTIQAILTLIAWVLILSGIGAVIGIPMGLLLCIWSVISVATAR
jgi:TM2 domain-containing membrane protein YozV